MGAPPSFQKHRHGRKLTFLNLAIRIPFTSHIWPESEKWRHTLGEEGKRIDSRGSLQGPQQLGLQQPWGAGCHMKRLLCRCLLLLKKGSLFLSSTSALLCPSRPSWNSIPFHIKDLEILPDGLYQGTAAWGQARTRWSPLATFLARNWLLENSHPHQITELHVGLPSNKPDSQVGQLRKPIVCTHKYTPETYTAPPGSLLRLPQD